MRVSSGLAATVVNSSLCILPARVFVVRVSLLTRAPLALQISTTYSGGGVEYPRLSRLLLVVERNGKKGFESSSKMMTKLFQSIFRQGQNCGPQG